MRLNTLAQTPVTAPADALVTTAGAATVAAAGVEESTLDIKSDVLLMVADGLSYPPLCRCGYPLLSVLCALRSVT